MSTSTAPPDTTSMPSNRTAAALAIGAVLAALGCVGYISLNGDTPRESYSNPLNTLAGIAATFGAVVLALTLAKWRTTTLPAWALTVSAAGLVMVAANSWFAGTGIRAVADHTGNEQFKELIFEAPWLIAMSVPNMVLCLVGFIALAVAGWRQRSLPRSSSVLLVLAGLLSVFPAYPPGLLFTSAALFIASRSMARSSRHLTGSSSQSAPGWVSEISTPGRTR